jgi:hypothetical protein
MFKTFPYFNFLKCYHSATIFHWELAFALNQYLSEKPSVWCRSCQTALLIRKYRRDSDLPLLSFSLSSFFPIMYHSVSVCCDQLQVYRKGDISMRAFLKYSIFSLLPQKINLTMVHMTYAAALWLCLLNLNFLKSPATKQWQNLWDKEENHQYRSQAQYKNKGSNPATSNRSIGTETNVGLKYKTSENREARRPMQCRLCTTFTDTTYKLYRGQYVFVCGKEVVAPCFRADSSSNKAKTTLHWFSSSSVRWTHQ